MELRVIPAGQGNVKKLTPELVRQTPWLAAIVARRAREVEQVKKSKANSSPKLI